MGSVMRRSGAEECRHKENNMHVGSKRVVEIVQQACPLFESLDIFPKTG